MRWSTSPRASAPCLACRPRDRQNYAQDVQISVRGFGARSTFGIRGVRLYVDGIPATLPDGQGQITHVELSSVGRIEVLRGPYSALYGNSSGGVIQVYTDEGSGPASLGFSVEGGSNGTLRTGVNAQGGSAAGFGYNVAASHFKTDGYRDHSAAERNLGNAKLTFQPDADDKLTLVANSVGLPRAQDPLGLSRAQFESDPRGVDPSAIAYDTRKTVNQTQVGAIYAHRVDAADRIQVLLYDGQRGTDQFQAIPQNTQGGALNPGGEIALARDYAGTDLRWTRKTQALDRPLTLIGGLAYDVLAEHRQGYLNFVGGTLGVRGALRRDEINDVTSFDQYLQAAWQLGPRWAVEAGVRHSHIGFNSTDQTITASNPNDSGGASYGATLPVLGVMFKASDAVHLYATAGRGFETPTLNELAYRSNGQTGLDFGLRAATSRSVEAGVKATLYGSELTAAAFRTDTANEIVTQTNTGGRATYQNAGGTRRTGVELGWSASWHEFLKAQLDATRLNAIYTDRFLTCTVTPCGQANVEIPAGNRLPGLARGTAYAALNWAPPTGWRGGVEARYVSGVFVNDLNNDVAPRYAVAAATLGHVIRAGAWELGGFVRGDNLFNRRYAGSVIVNEGNARYFEPAPGRTWLASATATVRF